MALNLHGGPNAMPGSPATSPRFGIPRYSDADPAAYSAQVNAITDGFDAAVARRLTPTTKSAAYTAADGDAVITTGSSPITITLPAAALGVQVAVINRTTSVTTVSGSNIQGVGLSSASSFQLGTVGAFAVSGVGRHELVHRRGPAGHRLSHAIVDDEHRQRRSRLCDPA